MRFAFPPGDTKMIMVTVQRRSKTPARETSSASHSEPLNRRLKTIPAEAEILLKFIGRKVEFRQYKYYYTEIERKGSLAL